MSGGDYTERGPISVREKLPENVKGDLLGFLTSILLQNIKNLMGIPYEDNKKLSKKVSKS